MILAMNRQLATDLLEPTAERTCSWTDPCPSGQPDCEIGPGQSTGVCPDPLSVDRTPPPLDPGATAIRLVFNKGLDPSIADIDNPDPTRRDLKDPTVAELLDPGGQEVAARKFYASGGDPEISSDPIGLPFGPAIVILPSAALSPGEYTIRLDATKIRDRSGATAAPIGAIAFTTEPLTVTAANPALTSTIPDVRVIAPNDALTLSLNADVDEATLTPDNVAVLASDGSAVATRAFAARGRDPSRCVLDGTTVVIVRSSSSGQARTWAEGQYALTIRGVRDVSDRSAIHAAPTSTTGVYAGSFTVTGPATDPAMDTRAFSNFVLPEACASAGAGDGGAPLAGDASGGALDGGDAAAGGGDQ